MALIAKIDAPLNVVASETAQLHARPYKAAKVQVGEEVFVWTSEMSGGHGLAARGTLVASSVESFPNKSGTGQHNELVLNVQIIANEPLRPLSLEQIAPHRDSVEKTPQATVGRVLYKHSLNKIASIESDVADFVRSHFEEQ